MSAVVGCAALTAPANGWMEVTGKDVVVTGCNATKEKRFLKCEGNHWSSEMINCTESAGRWRERRIIVFQLNFIQAYSSDIEEKQIGLKLVHGV